MIDASIQRLHTLCNTIPPLLHSLDEAAFSAKPAPGKWSKKEVLGHLVDSATNNHHYRALEEPKITATHHF